MPDEPLSLSGLLKAQEERDELLGAIDQSWRPEVRALRAEVARLKQDLTSLGKAYEVRLNDWHELHAEVEHQTAELDDLDTKLGNALRAIGLGHAENVRLRAALEHMVDVFGPLGRMGAGGPALDEARAALGRDKDG